MFFLRLLLGKRLRAIEKEVYDTAFEKGIEMGFDLCRRMQGDRGVIIARPSPRTIEKDIEAILKRAGF